MTKTSATLATTTVHLHAHVTVGILHVMVSHVVSLFSAGDVSKLPVTSWTNQRLDFFLICAYATRNLRCCIQVTYHCNKDSFIKTSTIIRFLNYGDNV